MSPEDDVKKDAEADSAADEVSSDDSNVQPLHNESQNEAQSQSQSQPQRGDVDDIDRAAKAQDDVAADAESAQNEGSDDDPLGFGSTRMDGEAEGEDELSQLQTKVTESEARIATLQDQLLRMQAEMENQRKRAQNDVTKAHKFALEKIALDLLPVKDSLEMGLQAATAEDAEPGKIVEGSELTLKMLAQALEKYNIIEVNPVDEKFDPEFHQAMSMQPVEGKEPNTVASVMQKGYTLNDRLIRPALVMVAK